MENFKFSNELCEFRETCRLMNSQLFLFLENINIKICF